jgi:hydrogenase nickel incorporation protein HypA/HybF
MHELALAQGILQVVLDVADGERAKTVRVSAGDLLVVSEDSLQFSFELVAQNTLAEAARLEVAIVSGDELLVDAIELEDGWRYRPDLVQTAESLAAEDAPA